MRGDNLLGLVECHLNLFLTLFVSAQNRTHLIYMYMYIDCKARERERERERERFNYGTGVGKMERRVLWWQRNKTAWWHSPVTSLLLALFCDLTSVYYDDLLCFPTTQTRVRVRHLGFFFFFFARIYISNKMCCLTVIVFTFFIN